MQQQIASSLSQCTLLKLKTDSGGIEMPEIIIKSTKDTVKIADGNWNIYQMSKICESIQQWSVKGMLFLIRNNESQIIKHITPINFPELNQLYLGHNLIVSVQPLSHLRAPMLEVIWIQNNLITTLKPLRKAFFPSLAYIRPSQNFLQDSQQISNLQISFLKSCYLEQNKYGRTQYQDIRPWAKCKTLEFQPDDDHFLIIYGAQRILQARVIECLKQKVKKFSSGVHPQ